MRSPTIGRPAERGPADARRAHRPFAFARVARTENGTNVDA